VRRTESSDQLYV